MMRKGIIFSFIVMNCLAAISQERNSFIAIRSGYSYPIGKYASYDLTEGSFATMGINASVEGGWFFKPYLGIGGQAGINLHSLNLQELAIAKIDADPFLSDLRIRSEEFQTITNTTGFYCKWSFLKKFQVSGKILSGIMWAKTPYQIYKPKFFIVGPEYYEITSSKDYSFLMIGGTGIQFSATPCLGLKIEGEYHYSNMTFGFNTANGLRNDHKVISFINLIFGLVINI